MVNNEISNIGNIYELLKMPDSALHYQQIALDAATKTSNRIAFVRPEIMFRMGNAYALKGENAKALDFYKKGVVEALFDNDIRNLTMNNLLLAKLYNEMNQADSSLKYAYSAIQSGYEVTFRKGIYEASMLISQLYKNKLRYDSAYTYLVQANVQKDSLFGTERFKELQRIILDEQQRLRETENKRVAYQNRQRIYALIAGLVVFVIIASILYRNNRQKQKNNKVLATTLADLKSTQSQLIQSEKMASLGELTAGIAHEIQNPLNFVNNFSELNKELLIEMKSELNDGNVQSANQIADTLIENEEKITHHGKRADSIVKGMLQHSRTSTGQKEEKDINQLTDEYLKLAYHGLRAKDKSFIADLKTDYDPKVKTFQVIPQEFGRVILNLVTNAFYAVTERQNKNEPGYMPSVWVSTRKLNSGVEIKVGDNGSGIPDDVIGKIFQPFYTTKPAGAGTGLGLSISYDVITKSHDGELKVATKKGQGTEFIIHLPARS
jgi:two-component system, NtrC family, sensor kinase